MQIIQPDIPFGDWDPLSVQDVVQLFERAPFAWCLAGGYAVEQFLGRRLREHGDIDVLVFRDQQQDLQYWLDGWQLYAADRPGCLRRWHPGEQLPVGIHDIWGHQAGAASWQLQIKLQESQAGRWFYRRNAAISGKRSRMSAVYTGIACLRPEIQLLYKSKSVRSKDQLDFEACWPRLDAAARDWLRAGLRLLYPQGHAWLEEPPFETA